MEARVNADRVSLEKDIVYMLRFLTVDKLIRVLHYIRKLW